MRRLLVACLLLGACTAPEAPDVWVSTAPPSAHPFRDYPDPAPTTTSSTTTTTVPEPTTTTTEPPRPPVTAASRSRGSTPCGGWEAQVAEAGDWDVADVCSVMRCESAFDPTATNGRYRGLMQVDGGSLDGETNLAQAFALWAQSRTWRRWSCKP